MMRISSYRTHGRGLGLVFAVLFCVLPALGQASSGVRIYQEHLRVKLDQQRPADREMGFDAGGWLNFALFSYDDASANRHRTLRQYQIRPWASLNIHNTHHFYVRGLLNWNNWADGDNPNRSRDTDFDETIERAWYRLDVGRLLWEQPGQASPYKFSFQVGRDFAVIGSSLVLAMPLDMLKFDVSVYDWDFTAMLGKTVHNTANIDASDPVANHQDRTFYGFELSYQGFSEHRPFAYFLTNIDHTSPSYTSTTQSYDYSSRYLGLGSVGSLFVPNFTYTAEVVAEWGRTYSENATTTQDRIRAWAADLQLQYLWQVPTHPRLKFEYLFGSGDSDRRTSSRSTAGGNLQGTTDNAFNAFGFRDTGIAFAPTVSNINIYMLEFRFLPLEQLKCELFKKMEVGTSVFFYNKNKSGGPISDSTAAANDARWLGWEWDVFCNWRLTSDLAWTMRYGLFQPGAAFEGDNDNSRHFLYTGLSFNF